MEVGMNITDYVSERLDGASQKELDAIMASDMSHVGDDPMEEAIAAELFSQAKERLSAIHQTGRGESALAQTYRKSCIHCGRFVPKDRWVMGTDKWPCCRECQSAIYDLQCLDGA